MAEFLSANDKRTCYCAELSAENIAEGACYIERYHTIYLYRCENEYQYEMNGSRTPLENGIFYFVGNGGVTVEKA